MLIMGVFSLRSFKKLAVFAEEEDRRTEEILKWGKSLEIKAIDELSKKGGGKLVVPQGVWHTGPIVLKSNIELHLNAGAVILFRLAVPGVAD